MTGSCNITVQNNTFSGNSDAFNIYMPWANNNTVRDNVMTGNNYGIYLNGSCNNTILNNAVSNAEGYGIVLEVGSNDNTVRGNVMTGNLAGAYLFRGIVQKQRLQ